MPKKQIQRTFAIAHDGDCVPFGLQVELQTLGQMGFVFDNQNMAHAGHVLRGAGNYKFTLGNSSTTVVPWPSPSLSANTRPPCFRAMARTMKRPRPVPFT